MSKNDRLHGAELDEAFQAAHKKIKTFDIISWTLSIIWFITYWVSFYVFALMERRGLETGNWSWVGLVVFILGLVFVARQRKHLKKAKQLISDNITRDALEEAFELIEYDSQKHIGGDLYWEAKPGFWAMSKGNDYIRAKYRGVEFMFSDVHFGADHAPDILFVGQWLIVSLSKEIDPPILISEWKIPERWGLQNALIEYNIQYEDGDHIHVFWTNKGDEHRVRNVLTPRFVETIMPTYGHKHMCFTGNRFHFAIGTWGDLFEACKAMSDISAARAMVQEDVDSLKNLVEAIIDELLLNEHLFGEGHIISAEKSND